MRSPVRRLIKLCRVLGLVLEGLYKTTRHFPASGGALSEHNHALMHAWFCKLLNCLNVTVEEVGQAPKPGTLLVSNHISWLDIPVLGSLAPISFVSKDDVKAWPLIGPLVTRSGTLYIKRGASQTQLIAGDMSSAIAAGRNIAFFPEGTTTDGRVVKTFHPRLFEAARLGDHPIQPVALRYIEAPHVPYIGDQSLLANIWALCSAEQTRVRVHWCPNLLDTQAQARKQLSQQARETIQAQLQVATAGH